jgi:hypothetical protein
MTTARFDAGSIPEAAQTLPRVDPVVASRLVEKLGFLAISDLPDRPGPALLAIAIRPVPTLHHFDPESVDYWVSATGKGVRRRLTRESPLPVESAYSWGLIGIADRLHVTNEYLSFGGWLAVGRVDDAVIAAFTSPAPLLRRGGHSQGWDHGAELLGAFFGRFLLAVDYRPGLEARAAAAEPLTRYATFLIDTLARYRSSPDLRDGHPDLWALVHAEARRLRIDHPIEWREGEGLRQELLSA